MPTIRIRSGVHGKKLGVGKLSDKLGRSDDRSVIYRTDHPEQRCLMGAVGRGHLTASLVVGVLVAANRGMDIEGLVSLWS